MKKREKVEFVIRELFGDQLEVLKPLLEAQGVVIPFPHLAMAKIAFEGDNIGGYVILQMVPHTEPLWVAPEYRGSGLASKLCDEIVEFAGRTTGNWVCVATNEFSEKLCKEQKMEVFPGTVFRGHA